MKITIAPFAIAMLSMGAAAINLQHGSQQSLAQTQRAIGIDPVEACIDAQYTHFESVEAGCEELPSS